MPKVRNSYVTRVLCGALMACASVAVVGAPFILSAQGSVAAHDLSDMEAMQQVSLSTDELYAPSLESMMSGEFGVSLEPRPGTTLAYLVNDARTHYISATVLPSGQVRVASDEKPESFTCAEYDAECAAKVSSDESLVNALPQWVTY